MLREVTRYERCVCITVPHLSNVTLEPDFVAYSAIQRIFSTQDELEVVTKFFSRVALEINPLHLGIRELSTRLSLFEMEKVDWAKHTEGKSSSLILSISCLR